MIAGRVTEEGEPIVLLDIDGETWPAIVDTGFNGDVELPEELRERLNPVFMFRDHSELAGGRSVEEDFYLVEFPFDGATMFAEATFAPGRYILIGTQLLNRHLLEMNFVKETVRLERVG